MKKHPAGMGEMYVTQAGLKGDLLMKMNLMRQQLNVNYFKN